MIEAIDLICTYLTEIRTYTGCGKGKSEQRQKGLLAPLGDVCRARLGDEHGMGRRDRGHEILTELCRCQFA